MQVDVLIVTRNRANSLRRALASALSQDCRDMRVVVWDDGSTDGTPALRQEFPGSEWHREAARAGCIGARNRWLRDTSADAVCLLDDDAQFLGDDVLARAVRCLNSDARVGAVAFDVISPGRPGRRQRGEPWPAHTFQGCGNVIRTAALREVGFFPEGPADYGSEEKDLSLRLMDRGYEILFLPGVYVWHERVPSGRSFAAQHASSVCNDMAWVLRRFPFPMVLWWLPAKALGNLRFSLRHGLLMTAIEGLARFALAIPDLLRERRKVRRKTLLEFWLRAKRFPVAMAAGFPEDTRGA